MEPLLSLIGIQKVFFTDQGSQPEDFTPARSPLWKRLAFRLINLPLTGVISISEYNARVMRMHDTYPPGRVRRIERRAWRRTRCRCRGP